MNIPKKIAPCPITEAIVELRFESLVPDEAVFGFIYNEFQKEYENVEKLPILQLPEAVRSQDPALVDKPHYKMHKGDYILQIGPRVFAFSRAGDYVGWEVFSKKMFDVLNRLSQLNIVKNIGRLGLRYINVFDGLNILDHSMLKILLDSKSLHENQTHLTMIIPSGNFNSRLVISNHIARSVNSGKKMLTGSVIDIDVALLNKITFGDIEKTIEEAHIEEKKLFFGLLKPDYLETLNPQY